MDSGTVDSSKQPLVSIVLPTYNRAYLLRQAVESVLAQTYPNIELLIVDDCSPDDTSDVVATIEDPRVRYSRNEQNLKLPGALNRGFDLAQGEFLTWTSDDNCFKPTAIERMVEHLGDSGCGLVYADYYHFEDLDPETGEPMDPVHERLPFPPELDKVNRIGACFLYTREVYEEIGDYNTELFLVEDYDYFIRISKKFELCHIPEPLYYFRRFDDSLFCSRFHEIKAADMLVRYRNRLLDKDQAAEALVNTILANKAQLKSPLLKVGSLLAKTGYWRFESAYKAIARDVLTRRINASLPPILSELDSGSLRFAEAKDRISAAIASVATLDYSR